jgi:hypothetical protein
MKKVKLFFLGITTLFLIKASPILSQNTFANQRSFCTAQLTAQSRDAKITLRSGPGANYSSKGYGLVGDFIYILSSSPPQPEYSQDSQGYRWYKVGFPNSGATGWIRNDFLNQTCSQNSQKPVTNSNPNPNPSANSTIQIIDDIPLFFNKLQILSSKLVKNTFETTAQYEAKKRQKIQEFIQTEGINLNETLAVILPINISIDNNNWQYDADQNTFLIYRNNNSFSFSDSSYYFNNTQERYEFYLENKEAQSNNNYWLDKKYKFSVNDPDYIAITKISPNYAQQLITEKRLFVKVFFKLNYPFLRESNSNRIIGEMKNTQIIDKTTGKVLWSLE